MTLRNLASFVADSTASNEYIQDFGLRSYYRKQFTLIEGRLLYVLCRANTKNVITRNRSVNMDIKAQPRSTGRYRALDELTLTLAVEHGFQAVLVECVVNQFLPTKLAEYSYQRLDRDGSINFFRIIESVSKNRHEAVHV